MKKLLAVLLSIMMLAMPLTSMAENSVWDNAARQETTITIHDLNADLVAALGGDAPAMVAINDLLAALSLTGYQQGDEAGFDLNLSGKSVLGMASLTTAAEENQLMYVSSALLGGVIAVNSKDVEAIKEKALRATMKMSGQSDEEIDKAIEESKEQLSGNAEYTALMEAAANLSSMTEEQLMEELTQADTTAFMTMMNEILSGEEMAEVTEQPGDCDAAKSYVKVTVPPEKIVEMTKALLEMIHSVPSVGAYMDALFSAADTSWDDLLKELDEADLYADDIVYEYWMTEAGELVRMTASVKINNGGEEPLPISFTMTRNTVVGAQLLVDLGHVLLDDCGQCVVDRVAGLTMLEEHVAVLVGTAHLGVLRVQCLGAELLNSLHVAHFLQISVIPLLDLLVLVRSTEAIEEVQEGDLALDCCQMGNRGQIHDFLHAALDQHCEAGLAACHDVAVITEDVQGLGSNGTCRNIEHAGQLLCSDLVHVGDHQQQALRSGEGGGNSTCTQRAVHSAGSAGLRLHLDDLDLVAEDVLLASCGPLVHRVSHRRRRGNGVDGSHVRVGICYMSGSGIAIHGLLCSRHFSSSIVQNLVPFARGNKRPGGAGEPQKALLLVYYNNKFRF